LRKGKEKIRKENTNGRDKNIYNQESKQDVCRIKEQNGKRLVREELEVGKKLLKGC